MLVDEDDKNVVYLLNSIDDLNNICVVEMKPGNFFVQYQPEKHILFVPYGRGSAIGLLAANLLREQNFSRKQFQ